MTCWVFTTKSPKFRSIFESVRRPVMHKKSISPILMETDCLWSSAHECLAPYQLLQPHFCASHCNLIPLTPQAKPQTFHFLTRNAHKYPACVCMFLPFSSVRQPSKTSDSQMILNFFFLDGSFSHPLITKGKNI